MLLASKLPELYYGEALMTACYLQNRWSEKGTKSRFENFSEKNLKLIICNLLVRLVMHLFRLKNEAR